MARRNATAGPHGRGSRSNWFTLAVAFLIPAPVSPSPNPRSAAAGVGVRPRVMAARAPPALPDELVEEVLLRVPPDDPARLMRAALACKPWRRLVAGPGFRRRFGERHRTPPVLGFLLNSFDDDDDADRGTTRFVPTCSFRPRRAVHRGWRAIDSRHGRVLLHREPWKLDDLKILAVWNPVADELWELPALPRYKEQFRSNIVVLCAAADEDCNHLDCSGGPFRVVVVGADTGRMFAYAYSSEAGAWSEPVIVPDPGFVCQTEGGVLAGNALYFVLQLEDTTRVLEYNLNTREFAVINPPPMPHDHIFQLMTVSGGLRAITIVCYTIDMWSKESGPDGDVVWARREGIELNRLIPVGAVLKTFNVFGGCVAYIGTNRGYFTADLKTGQVRILQEVRGGDDILPYMSFYTPALGVASTGESPRAGASSAQENSSC
ncbi:hypothetical protein ACP70R_046332 [Stipagrostis hirtigluma subsp. patula]